jgi:hypothetical protein
MKKFRVNILILGLECAIPGQCSIGGMAPLF